MATPTIYFADARRALLVMEFIEGSVAKEVIAQKTMALEQLGRLIGEIIAVLHSHDIIHGDLTTSNIIIRADTQEPVLIDFGLASVSGSVEDRAVDLYVLERAILSTHPECGAALFEHIRDAYASKVTKSRATLVKLADVQQRGRKREMVG